MFVTFVIWIVSEGIESLFTPSVAAIVALLSVQFFGGVNIFGYVVHNPLTILKWSAIYFVVGAVWGTLKWWLFVLNERDLYQQRKKLFFDQHNLKDGDKIPSALAAPWYSFMGTRSNLPTAAEHGYNITRWIAYWPASMFWYFFHDALEKIGRFVFRAIRSFLQSIADRVFRGVKVEVEREDGK